MALTIIQIIIAVLLIGAIVLQMQGKGFAGAYGGGDSYRSKRSLEKFLVWATITLSILFALVAIILLIHK